MYYNPLWLILTFLRDYESLVKQDSCGSSDQGDDRQVYSPEFPSFLDDFNACNGSICTYSESLECDVIYSAPPLQDYYKYHIFFSHSPEDETWVIDIIAKLESEPYNYKCFYTNNRDKTKLGASPDAMCAAMLSERVVIVLTRHYVKSTWFEFQDILQNFTHRSLYRQRILVVLLRDCVIPEHLEPLGFLDAREEDFFKCFARHLRSDRLPRSSESFSSEISCVLYTPHMEYGQLLATVHIDIIGRWKAKLIPSDDEDVPTPLCCHGISMSYGEFIDILQAITGVVKVERYFGFLFSMRPIALLLIIIGIWSMVFVTVLIYLKDESKQSALWVRLPVFSLPLFFVLAGYGIRWKRQRSRDKIFMEMLSECVTINETLYQSEKPLLCTTTTTRDGGFALHFVYITLYDCMTDADMLLNTYLEEDAEKFAILIELYTKNRDYLIQGTMTERLVVMMSAAYLNKMVARQLPPSKPERHCARTICLCQEVELFIDDLYRSLLSERLIKELQHVFLHRLKHFIPKERIKPHVECLTLQDDFGFMSA